MTNEGDRHWNLPPHLKIIRSGFVGFDTWSEMGPKKETKSAAGMVDTRLLYIFTLKSRLVGMMPSCDSCGICLFGIFSFVPFLLENGYKVLVYDHYGRGYSSRPKVKYTKSLYVDSLNELIESQKIDEKVNLVGYSMGGPIVAGFSEKFSSNSLPD